MNTTFSLVTRRAIVCLAVLNLVVAVGTAHGDTIEYANPSGAQDFTVGANWVGGVAPGDNDEAQINGVDGVIDYAYLDTTSTVQRLQIGVGEDNSGGLELRNGASLFVTENANGAADIGVGAGAVGHLRISNGAFLSTAHSLRIGQIGAEATAIQDGGEINSGLGLRLANGADSSATYTLNNGTFVNGGLFQIGGGEDSVGTFYMHGGSVTVNERFRMARNGASATFVQTGGNMVAVNGTGGHGFELAMQGTNSSGLYEISGGSFMVDTTTSGIVIGSDDTATATIRVIGDAPTISIGTKYEQQAGGTLALEIGTGISPINVVAGLALLDGTLDVTFTETPGVGQQFTIMNYDDLLDGGFSSFDNVVDSPLGTDTVTLSIDYGTSFASSVVLTVDGIAEPPIPGDYNGDTVVDLDDYSLWVANFGSTSELAADGSGNGIIDAADYTMWRDNHGASLGIGAATVPEPGSSILMVFGGIVALTRRWSRIS